MGDAVVDTDKRDLQCQGKRTGCGSNGPEAGAKSRTLGECDPGDLCWIGQDLLQQFSHNGCVVLGSLARVNTSLMRAVRA